VEFIIGWMTVLSFAIRERHDSYNMWSSNVNRVNADALVERKYSEFVPGNLDPSLPPRKLYYNLRRLGPKRFNGDIDVERLSSFFFYETVIEYWD
jgi:hypothetical protein